MRHTPKHVAATILLLVALVAAGCSSSSEPTSTIPDTTTTVPEATTSTTAAPTTTTTTTAPATTTTTVPSTTTTTVPVVMPTPEETDEAVSLLTADANEVVLVFLNQVAGEGRDWVPLSENAPYGGAALTYAQVWDSRQGAGWDSCQAQGACPDREVFGNAEHIDRLGGQRTQVPAGSDESQIFPLGNDQWLAYGVYTTSGFLLTDGNSVSDFVFHVDGDRLILEDMVVWTTPVAAADATGIWMSDLVYGSNVMTIDPIDGLDVEAVAGVLAGVESEYFAQGMIVQLRASSPSAYTFDGMGNVVPEGTYSAEMAEDLAAFQALTDVMWSAIRPAYADAGETIDMAFRQLDFRTRILSDPHVYEAAGLGTVTIGNETLERPGLCKRRDADETPEWVTDRESWTCLAWADYDPSAVQD